MVWLAVDLSGAGPAVWLTVSLSWIEHLATTIWLSICPVPQGAPAAWLAVWGDLCCLAAGPCPSQTLTLNHASVGLLWPLQPDLAGWTLGDSVVWFS